MLFCFDYDNKGLVLFDEWGGKKDETEKSTFYSQNKLNDEFISGLTPSFIGTSPKT